MQGETVKFILARDGFTWAARGERARSRPGLFTPAL